MFDAVIVDPVEVARAFLALVAVLERPEPYGMPPWKGSVVDAHVNRVRWCLEHANWGDAASLG